MSYEVQCGECSEVILIEDLGVEVACPHCAAVLILHESDVSGMRDSETPESASTDEQPSFPPPSEEPVEAARDESIPNFDFLGDAQETTEFPLIKIDVTGGAPAAAESVKERTAEASDSKREDNATESQNKKFQDKKTAAEKPERKNRLSARKTTGVSDLVFKSLVSYSIFVTLALLYLMYSYRMAKPHQLESLPDIQPWKPGEFIKIEENAMLPPGHSLRLGETQQFGNIRVTPLRVTREPLRFVHFEGAGAGSKSPSNPVLKLWLKIENVSSNQKFAPLDQKLALLRHVDPKDYQNVMANTWVCRMADLRTKHNRTFMYDHPTTSNYNIQGMSNHPIGPGDSIETFLPTQDEQLESLQGELVWRIQIRKGFNPDSMNGVTTLIDVIFDSNDISQG
ncbi:MAG TPA: hypothetical protein VMM56_15185 [Planctomycetaceae bacterium]|nr:hypothetical protein [Planctomycetaceae bacterium]